VSDNAELHGKILGFLMAEWARKDNRQLIGVDLLYAPGNGFKDEEIRKWIRADEPELFAEFVNIEKLVSLIVEIAEGEADAKPAGKHRFIVRTQQHMGRGGMHSFALQPSFRGSEDLSLMSGGGGAGGGRSDSGVIANHAGQLMRINAQMFEGTIRVFGQQNLSLHEQVNTLTAENMMLRRELEDARSNKMEREFQHAMAAEKNARTNMAFKQVLQLGTVVVAKIGAGQGGQSQVAGGPPSPLAMLIADFSKSLRPEQGEVIMKTLDMSQKIMFMEIVNQVRASMPPDEGPGGPGQPPPGQPGPGAGAPAAPRP
jgi:hypothetical protein